MSRQFRVRHSNHSESCNRKSHSTIMAVPVQRHPSDPLICHEKTSAAGTLSGPLDTASSDEAPTIASGPVSGDISFVKRPPMRVVPPSRGLSFGSNPAILPDLSKAGRLTRSLFINHCTRTCILPRNRLPASRNG